MRVGFESHPLAAIDEWVRAERTTEIATLGRDVVELALTFEFEVAFDGNQSIVVRAKLVHLSQRPRRILVNGAVGEPDGAPRAVIERAPLRQTLNDLCKCLLSLSTHRHVDRAFRQTLAGKHGRMPASPDYRQLGSCPLRRARYAQRIGDRRAGQYRDPEAQGVLDVRQNRIFRIWVKARIDRYDLVEIRVEFGADREQRQRHGEKDRPRIVQDDFEPFAERLARRARGCSCRREYHGRHAGGSGARVVAWKAVVPACRGPATSSTRTSCILRARRCEYPGAAPSSARRSGRSRGRPASANEPAGPR